MDNSGLKLGENEIFLQVIGVSVYSQKAIRGLDTNAKAIITVAGFVEVDYFNGRLIGQAPAQDTFFILRYDQSTPGRYKGCQLVRVDKFCCREIETGRSFSTLDQPLEFQSEIWVLGDGHIKDWVLTCRVPTPKMVAFYTNRLGRQGIYTRRMVIPYSFKRRDLEDLSPSEVAEIEVGEVSGGNPSTEVIPV